MTRSSFANLFLRPYLDDYATLSSIYAVVRNAYSKTVYVDRAFQKKTNELVQKHIGATQLEDVKEFIRIDSSTIDVIRNQDGGDSTKVINLIKSIQKAAEEERGDPYLIAIAERAKLVQERFEDRQTSTADALSDLLKEIAKNERRKKDQAAKGLDAVSYFVLTVLEEAMIPNPEETTPRIADALTAFPNWRRSEAELREVRNLVTFALVAVEDDLDKVSRTVDDLLDVLGRSSA